MFGNLGNMMDMFGKMKDIQARMQEAQQSLSTLTETGESGAGMVRATVNGLKQVIKLDIDPDMVKSIGTSNDDREMLQDLVVAAINKAMETMEPKIREHLRKSTEGLLPNIPGMDLGSMMP
ncbi:YbaB/EbfC family nucleoid-associated protein [Rudanella paleaurantiibacter]|uniref:Nucleoid-associated protein F5984_01325 n=1 Tax=Rudanella paleaurantiibacter TaxID=2614655 RepID=A0A7J5U4W3_9BACT|nr:YbaB/EbfC family nucleoid-associated protein [Rudanella paleaurantiibacter]KAB7732627.1 YbaB/EbfC family nucleoid-associated protein [Rudanella paleaurantiibacter]